MGINVFVKCGNKKDLLVGATTNVTGNWVPKDSINATFQASITGTGAVAATVTIEVSNDGVNAAKTSLGVITLSGTTTDSDGFATNSAWVYVRAKITGISGTGATVSVNMGT